MVDCARRIREAKESDEPRFYMMEMAPDLDHINHYIT